MKKIILILVILLQYTQVYSAFLPLEIVSPKTAGTGTPVIPSDHPVFRAYTGIPYNIKPVILGGLYPFMFALSGEPSGMIIDSSTGEINWPTPTVGTTSTITLTVTDDEATMLQSTWQIVVGTTGYLFIDGTYVGVETGSITQPYSTIENMLTNTTSANVTDIVYFRAGIYQLPIFNSVDSSAHDCNFSSYLGNGGKPSRWIAYPEESVTVDCDANYFQGGVTPWYIDNINFIDIPDWLFHEVSSGMDYVVIRRSDISGARCLYRTDNANQGIYYTEDGADGYYYSLSDNNIHDLTSVHAAGSYYNQQKMVIENNTVYDIYIDPVVGARPIFAMKVRLHDISIRRNNIVSTASVMGIGGSLNGMFLTSSNIDISFNRVKVPSSALWFNERGDTEPILENAQLATNLIRNTIEGYVVLSYIDGDVCSNAGPWTGGNNVVINDNNSAGRINVNNYTYRNSSNSPATCNLITADLIGAVADSIIDSSGLLLGSYRDAYLGVAGWELADSVNPTLTLQADFSTSSATTSFTFTGTSAGGATVSSVVSNDGTASITSGAGTDSVSGTVSGVSLTSGVNVVQVTLTDSAASTDIKTINITYTPAVPTYTAKAKKCTIKKLTLK